MLYWSTEPQDNPHYVKLLAFRQQPTGVMPCTAAVRAGEDRVRKLVDYDSTGPAP